MLVTRSAAFCALRIILSRSCGFAEKLCSVSPSKGSAAASRRTFLLFWSGDVCCACAVSVSVVTKAAAVAIIQVCLRFIVCPNLLRCLIQVECDPDARQVGHLLAGRGFVLVLF